MGDRGNIAILQSSGTAAPDQIWFYSHWTGYQLPEALQTGLKDGKGRWGDDPYLTRIIFDRMIPAEQHGGETGFGISGRIGDNSHPIIVCDMVNHRVFTIEETQLDDGRVPVGFKPEKAWTFEEYVELKTLP